MVMRAFVGLAVACLIWAWAGYVNCTLTLADAMGRELNPLTETGLEAQIAEALDGAEPPQAYGDQISVAHPYCYAENSVSDNGLSYALALFFFIVALFARNQARHIERLSFGEGRTQGSDFGRRDEPIPDEIDVGHLNVGLSDRDKELLESVGNVNKRDESLILYLDRNPSSEASDGEDVPADFEGYYLPPGYHDKPTIYVDPDHDNASDDLSGEDPVDNKDRPFQTINGALQMAEQLKQEGHEGVMVRLMPGVYHASIEIPDRVVVCNHYLPADGSSRSRLKWLAEQKPEDEDNVTILTPPGAKFAVRFLPGQLQGIFGCHIVGREDVKQVGIAALNCRSTAIMNCSIEGFTGGGIKLKTSGSEIPGGSVVLAGCRIHRNEAQFGGALFAEQSSVSIADSIIEWNRALSGGAIYLVDSRGPLFIGSSRVAYNRAQLESPPDLDVEGTPLQQWLTMEGMGGGLYAKNSKVKASGAEFVENGASVAGGGIALLNSKAVLESEDEHWVRLARNRSRLGAGMAVFGAVGARGTVKATDAVFEQNSATMLGGGLVCVGVTTVQTFQSEFVGNEISKREGLGAGAAAVMGAELLVWAGDFAENKSAGHAGGLAVVNASASLKGETTVRDNVAAVSGGGLFAMTTTNPLIRQMVKNKVLSVPFALTMEDTKIDNNVSGKLGGGLRGGNTSRAATIPLGFKFGENVRFQLNRAKSQKEHGDDVWIVWAGDVKADDRNRPEKLVLR